MTDPISLGRIDEVALLSDDFIAGRRMQQGAIDAFHRRIERGGIVEVSADELDIVTQFLRGFQRITHKCPHALSAIE